MDYDVGALHLENIRRPSSWVGASLHLLQSARLLFEHGVDLVSRKKTFYFKIRPDERTHAQLRDLSEGVGMKNAAFMLYGLAVENALKGYLIANKPSKVSLVIESDGEGRVRKVEIKRLGVNISKGHDLESLLKAAGIFGEGEDRFARYDERGGYLNAMSILTEYVTWRARYPAPLQKEFNNQLPNDPSSPKPVPKIGTASTVNKAERLIRYLLLATDSDAFYRIGGNDSMG